LHRAPWRADFDHGPAARRHALAPIDGLVRLEQRNALSPHPGKRDHRRRRRLAAHRGGPVLTTKGRPARGAPLLSLGGYRWEVPRLGRSTMPTDAMLRPRDRKSTRLN